MQNATTTNTAPFKSFGAKGFATGAARKALGLQDVAAYITTNDEGKFGFYTDAAGLPTLPLATVQAQTAELNDALLAATSPLEALQIMAAAGPQVSGDALVTTAAAPKPAPRAGVVSAFQAAADRKAARNAPAPAPVAPTPVASEGEADHTIDTSGPFGGMAAALVKGAEAAAAKAAANPAAASGGSARTCKVEKDRPMQNGIKRPSEGGLCRAVWDFCDAAREKSGGTAPTAKDVKAYAETVGWNMNNACIEFYQWRKYNGITGRAPAAKPATPAAE